MFCLVLFCFVLKFKKTNWVIVNNTIFYSTKVYSLIVLFILALYNSVMWERKEEISKALSEEVTKEEWEAE
jgi:hypothetical protein